MLSILDTQPHPSFTLEDKENLLDLGAAVAQLVGEKLTSALNLSAERANIVVCHILLIPYAIHHTSYSLLHTPYHTP
ncbi:hypothetical protein EON64_18660 [archaeon]|nr:MAG: hypothetical protein EON64_18660 [archaeon]